MLLVLLLPLGGCRYLRKEYRINTQKQTLSSGRAGEKLETLKKVRVNPDEQLREALENLLRHSTNPTVRALAAETIGNLEDADSIEQLRHAHRRDVDQNVRKEALIALAKSNIEDLQEDILYSISNDPAPLVRITALDIAVESIEDENLYLMLINSLEDPAEAVRLTAYHHLNELTGLDYPPNAPARWRENLGIAK